MNGESREIDLIIRGGTLLTLADGQEPVTDPVIGIQGEWILFVEKGGGTVSRHYRARKTIDASGSLILPGLVNTHTHVPMVAFRGLADDLPLMDWLRHHIFPAESKYVNREMVYDCACLAVAEMILSGTTTFCDAYFHESGVAQAALEAGMRCMLAAGFLDFSFPDSSDPVEQKRVAGAFIAKWTGRSGLITPALFCHSPYTCTPETLRLVKAIAREARVPYLTHLAETREEVKITTERFGLTPVRHLQRLGVLDDETIAVHAVWVDDEEIEILARSGVKVAHCPESNMKLASGFCPLTKLLDRGIVVGLGTDGAASNNDLDMFGEMDKAAKVDKVARMDPTVMNAERVLRMATLDGARVLGLDSRIGSIEPGKLADLILIDLRRPHLTPLYNPYSHAVYSASGADVKTSIINGRIVMEDRRILTMNIDEAMRKVTLIAESIKKDRGLASYSLDSGFSLP